MAEPSEKSLGMGLFLEGLTGRTSQITDSKCIKKPFGCEEPVGDFRDALSVKEYVISGMCQACQDKAFGTDEEEF